MLTPQLKTQKQTQSGNLLPIHKLAIFLQYLRTNGFHKSVAAVFFTRVSQALVTITINSVSRVVASFRSKYVVFPDEEEGNRIAASFFEETKFPGIVGVIDGVHFKIMRPYSKDPIPEKFFNRKNCYSLNSVMICDEERRIRWFTSRHAGSAHDSRIWEESHLKAELARRLPRHLQYLIGDEGFACSSTLLTIVRSAEVGKITDPEFLTKVKAYNRALKKARVRIEHTFGCLKKRWPALLYTMRSSKIANIQAIISSAIVLHNFLLQDLDPISTIPDDEFERQIAEMRMDNINSLRRGQYRVRNHVIHTFF